MYNNPTLPAIEEARALWQSDGSRNTVLSIGCGTAKERLKNRNGPLSCCTNSFFESMSAAKQSSDLQLKGYHFTRLDPFLDVDVVSLDDFAAIPKLQESFSTMLSHNVAFVELLNAAAFHLLSSLFYFELVDSQPAVRTMSGRYSIMGMIRPRIPTSSLKHLNKHHVFHQLCYKVNEKLYSFSMPKKVSFLVKDLDSTVEVLLCSKSHQARVSGSPMSVSELFALQKDFYRRSGSLKHHMTLKSCNKRARLC